MLWHKWFPWRFLVRKMANAHGFADPITLLAYLERFSQPAEVAEPIELLRAGVIFHSRGLINTKVIQNNLDWVWPYWVERQFDPSDNSFLPRAFSITHVNLTHRNWTAIGIPDFEELPIVDPRGLVTPFFDGWSIDSCIHAKDGATLFPSRAIEALQRIDLTHGVTVQTEVHDGARSIRSSAWGSAEAGEPCCKVEFSVMGKPGDTFCVAARPYNAEGISFIESIAYDDPVRTWIINGKEKIQFAEAPVRQYFSDYRKGDVYGALDVPSTEREAACSAGLLSAAAEFELSNDGPTKIGLTIPLHRSPETQNKIYFFESWEQALAPGPTLKIPDQKILDTFNAAVRTLVLLSPSEVYPGPYTYKRFWFRDAAYMLHALLSLGFEDRAKRCIARFNERQGRDGYYLSQEGEWDSNGEVLWTLKRFAELYGLNEIEHHKDSLIRAADWIVKKRLPHQKDSAISGLLPAGFSAEHLGPNDHYYWDDFWGVAGLQAAAWIFEKRDDPDRANRYRLEAESFMKDIEASLGKVKVSSSSAMAASPHRRLDAGAIGSIVAGYPLQLFDARDPRLLDTAEFLVTRCFHNGAFFQDIIHSGLNAYLTLHVAQVLLRAGDTRFWELVRKVSDLASPTGQWPEAIHPLTLGGCMGDGQHGWAAAEWLLIIRNMFVREEGDLIIIGSGIPSEWMEQETELVFGPAPVPGGNITVRVRTGAKPAVEVDIAWRLSPLPIEVRIPGHKHERVQAGANSVNLTKDSTA